MSTASPQSMSYAPKQGERTFLGHPTGLYWLFNTELWERFSFYSMRAFLTLYMTKALALSDSQGNEIYGAYLGFVYAAPFVGGMLADKLLGQRRAIVIGGLLMAAAQLMLAGNAWLMQHSAGMDPKMLKAMFFVALGLMSAGNGFFKPNISSIVGSLYERTDSRRDQAFTIFYMGINIGALLAGLSGQLAESKAWYLGFLVAGIGMLLGQTIFFFAGPSLKGQGLPPPRKDSGGIMPYVLLTFGVLVFIPVTGYLMANPKIVQSLALIVAVPILGYLVWEAFRSEREERDRMFVLLILCAFSIMFWAFFELAGSAINIFTDRNVDRVVPYFGELKASLITASTNALFIVILASPFAVLWLWLGKRRMEPSSPLKFALGLLQLAAGFFVMYLGAKQAGPDGRCHIMYLVIGFLLHTTGELCLSPVGLSTMTKLAPARMVSTVMGVWFLSSSLGNIFGGYIGGLTEHAGFASVFFWIAVATAISAVLLIALVAPLKRMMHGVK